MSSLSLEDVRLAVVGLGYVGLPLAVAFAQHRAVVGYDVDGRRAAALRDGLDHTREVTPDDLRAAGDRLRFTADPADLAGANVFVVTAPTPIDDHKRPDLGPLLSATRTVGRHLKPGDVVVYESTVYPGATEEDCAPVLEQTSGLTLNTDFFLGYSPERINPGDPEHRLPSIRKVTAGSTPETALLVDALYSQIVPAGTHRAPSIRVAEAAKVIENTQRDVNIALVNELAIIFGRMGIDTEAVLEAAATKWNFVPFRPGLVGGHCIGVDPYYLTHKAQSVGYHPEIILAGRRLNDAMGIHVAAQLVKAMTRRGITVSASRVLVLGLAFKENCPDTRNTRVADLVHELEDYGVAVDVHDPWVDAAEAKARHGIGLVADLDEHAYDAVVLAVAHSQFRQMGASGLRALGRDPHVLYDLRYVLAPHESDLRL